MDLLEHSSFKVPMILLQTVLEEVRHRSLPLYSRLKQLSQSEDKVIWVFYNEFSSETSVVRTEDETPNDKNDRSIRVATQWYNEHIIKARHHGTTERTIPVVVLLTDDLANRERAKDCGIPAIRVKDYVSSLPEAGHLLDVLATNGPNEADSIRTASKQPNIYSEHLSVSSSKAGVASGHFHQGHFNASKYNYLEGTVNVPAFSKPVLLVGRENMNRAVDGDIVAVEVYPQSEWRTETDEVLDQEATLKDDDPEDSDAEDDHDEETSEKKAIHRESPDTKLDPRKGPSEPQPTGKIVGIIRRNWRAYVCHIDRTSLSSHVQTGSTLQTVFATPLSRSIPRIRLRTRQAPSLLDQKILVTMDRWDSTSRYPEGHFVRSLGKVESKEAERESLLLEYEIPFRPFGRAVRECLPPEGDSWVVPPKEETSTVWAGRRDLRDLLICSIDPPGCQDIDDALHARRLPNGNVETGELTPAAEIVNVQFFKSVIASKMAFTYEEAQKRIDDRSLSDPLTESMRLLNSLSRRLKAARMAAGALNLASPEIKIHLQSAESSDPVDVEQKALFETNSLVEEFMLLANVSVARRIHEAFPQTAVLRRHVAPPKTNFEKLQDILRKRRGIELDVSSSGALAASLDKCIDPDDPSFNTLVRIMATRCMLAAEYFASGSVARDAFSHYGLASPIYTHFTSPIRRYADVLVHRQLSAAIDFSPLHASLHSRHRVEQILDNINRRHRMAQMASRASTEFYTGLALKARETLAGGTLPREHAFVIRTFRNGISVFVSGLGLEGLILFEGSTSYDADNYTVTVHSQTGGDDLGVSVFDQVEVEISIEKDRNTQRGKVKMQL
ncbi:exosome catalytic subunit dis3, partial [Tulasnella sp. 427]